MQPDSCERLNHIAPFRSTSSDTPWSVFRAGKHDVVRDRKPLHESEFLMDHDDPVRCSGRWAGEGHGSPVQFHRSRIRRSHTADDAHEGALAGSVLADD